MVKSLKISVTLTLLITLFSSEAFSSVEYAGQQEPYATQTFTVRGVPTVSVRPGQGTIKLVGTEDATEVRVEVYAVRRGLAILSSDKIAEDYRVVLRQRNNDIHAEIVHRRGGALGANAPTFNVVVYAPHRTNASLSTQSGDVQVDAINGTVDIRNNNGNITLRNTRGTARLASAAGSINVVNHNGTVFGNAISGDVLMEDIQGETRVRLVDGNAILERMFGSCIVHVINGNVNISANRIDELIDIEAVRGDIQIILPGSSGFDLNVTGSTVDLGSIVNFAGDIRRNSVTGKMDGGGVPVRVKTLVGNIKLDVAGRRP